MKDVHITRELLESVHDLDMPQEIFLRLIWDHVQALCPTCHEAIRSWLAGAKRRSYDGAFENALAKIEAHAGEADQERRKVDREFTELLRLAPDDAVKRVVVARKRFRSPHLVERLIEESETHLHGDPRRSAELLECARAIVERPAEEVEPDLRVRVLAHYGNALRACRETRKADDVLSAARHLSKGHYIKDVLLYALLDSYQGSLRRQQYRYADAKNHLARAVLIYRVFEEERAAAKALLKLSSVYFSLSRSDDALEAIHEAIELIDPETDLKLAAIARQNLASYLCDAGDPQDARVVLGESRELIERYIHEAQAEVAALSFQWLEGKIARNLGEHKIAERTLFTVAEGYADFDMSYDVALVLLDLAESYLASGDSTSVKRLVAEIDPLLVANDLDQEIVSALLLFQNAIEQELLSTSTIAMVRRKIEKVGRRIC